MQIVSPLTVATQLGKHTLNAVWDTTKNYNTNLTTLATDAKEIQDTVIKKGKNATEIFNEFKTHGLKKFTDWFFAKEEDFSEFDLDNGDNDFDAGFEIGNGLEDEDVEESSTEILDARSMKDITRGQVGAMYQIGGKQVEAAAMNASEIISSINQRSSEIVASVNTVNKTLGEISSKIDKLIMISPGYIPEKKREPREEGLVGYDGQVTLGSAVKALTKEISGYTESIGMLKDVFTQGSPSDLIGWGLGFLTDKKIKKFGNKSVDDIAHTINDYIGAAIDETFTSLLSLDKISEYLDVNSKQANRNYSYITPNHYTTDPAKFDGITRQTIIEIIPDYLKKITEAISGVKYNINQYGHLTTKDTNDFHEVTRAAFSVRLGENALDYVSANTHDDRITRRHMQEAARVLGAYYANLLYMEGLQALDSGTMRDNQKDAIKYAVNMLTKYNNRSVDWKKVCRNVMTYVMDDLQYRRDFANQVASAARRMDDTAEAKAKNAIGAQALNLGPITSEMYEKQYSSTLGSSIKRMDLEDEYNEKIKKKEEERDALNMFDAFKRKAIDTQIDKIKKEYDKKLQELEDEENGEKANANGYDNASLKSTFTQVQTKSTEMMSDILDVTSDIFNILNRGINVKVIKGKKPFSDFNEQFYNYNTPSNPSLRINMQTFATSKSNSHTHVTTEQEKNDTSTTMQPIDYNQTTTSLPNTQKSTQSTLSMTGIDVSDEAYNSFMNRSKPNQSSMQNSMPGVEIDDKRDQSLLNLVQSMIQGALSNGNGVEDFSDIRRVLNQVSDPTKRNLWLRNVERLLKRNTAATTDDPSTPAEKKPGLLGGLFSGLLSKASAILHPVTMLLTPITSLVKVIGKPLIELAKRGFRSGARDIRSGASQIWHSIRGTRESESSSDESGGDGDEDGNDNSIRGKIRNKAKQARDWATGKLNTQTQKSKDKVNNKPQPQMPSIDYDQVMQPIEYNQTMQPTAVVSNTTGGNSFVFNGVTPQNQNMIVPAGFGAATTTTTVPVAPTTTAVNTAGATGAAGAAAEGGAATVAKSSGKLVGIISGATKMLGGVGKIILTLIASLTSVKVVIELVKKAITAGIRPLNKAIRQLTKSLRPIIRKISNLIKQIANFVVKIVDTLMKLIDPIMKMLEPLLDAVMTVLNPILGLVTTLVDVVTKFVEPLLPIVEAVIENLSGILEIATSFINDIITPFIEMFEPIAEEFGKTFAPFITEITEILNPIRETFVSLALKVFAPQAASIKNTLIPAVEYISNLLKTGIGVIEIGFGGMVTAIGSVISAIGFLNSLVLGKSELAQIGSSLHEGGQNMVQDGVKNVGEGVKGMFNASVSFWDSIIHPTATTTEQSIVKDAAQQSTQQRQVAGGSILDGIAGSGNPMDQHSYGSYMNMAERGCGPVALADVINRRTGSGVDAAALAASMAGSGAYSTRRGTSIGGFLDTANAAGLGMQLGGVTANSLRYATPNNPITIIGSGSEYGTRAGNNHYVNVLGTDGSGMAYVSNPLTGRVERHSASALAAASLAGLYGSGDISAADIFGDAFAGAFEDLKTMASNLLGIFGVDSGIGSAIDEITNGQQTTEAAKKATNLLTTEELQQYTEEARKKFEEDHPKLPGESDTAYEKRWKKYANKYLVEVSKDAVAKHEQELAASSAMFATNQQQSMANIGSILAQANASSMFGSMFGNTYGVNGGYTAGAGGQAVVQAIIPIVKAYESVGIVGNEGDYNQGARLTLHINGKDYTEVRPDCSGFTSTVIEVLGYKSGKTGSNGQQNATHFDRYDGQNPNNDWTFIDNPDLSQVQMGDIVIYDLGPGPDVPGHAEIAAGFDKDGTLYGWNYGSSRAIGKTLQTVNNQLAGMDPLTAAIQAGNAINGWKSYTRIIRYNGMNAMIPAYGQQTSSYGLVNQGMYGTSQMYNGSVEEQVWYYLTNVLGFTKEAAAGVMGNLEAESGMIPNNLENTYNSQFGMTDEEYTAAVDSGAYPRAKFVSDHNSADCGAGYGLPQFTWHTLKEALYDNAKSRGVSIADVGTQLDTVAQTVDSKLVETLRSTRDIRTASDAWLKIYERPADISGQSPVRANNAQKWYQKFANWMPNGAQLSQSTYMTNALNLSNTTTPVSASSVSTSNMSKADIVKKAYDDAIAQGKSKTEAANIAVSIAMTLTGSGDIGNIYGSGDSDSDLLSGLGSMLDNMIYGNLTTSSTSSNTGSSLLDSILSMFTGNTTTTGLSGMTGTTSGLTGGFSTGATQGMIDTSRMQAYSGGTWDSYKNKDGIQQFFMQAAQSQLSPAQTALIMSTGIWEDSAKKLLGTKDLTRITYDYNGQAAVGLMNWIPKTNNGGHDYSYGRTLAEQLSTVYQYYFSPNPTHSRGRVSDNESGYANAFQQLTGRTLQLKVGDAYGPYIDTDLMEGAAHYVGGALVPAGWNSASGLGKYLGVAADVYNWMLQNGYATSTGSSLTGMMGMNNMYGMTNTSTLGGMSGYNMYNTNSLMGGYNTGYNMYNTGGYNLGTGYNTTYGSYSGYPSYSYGGYYTNYGTSSGYSGYSGYYDDSGSYYYDDDTVSSEETSAIIQDAYAAAIANGYSSTEAANIATSIAMMPGVQKRLRKTYSYYANRNKPTKSTSFDTWVKNALNPQTRSNVSESSVLNMMNTVNSGYSITNQNTTSKSTMYTPTSDASLANLAYSGALAAGMSSAEASKIAQNIGMSRANSLNDLTRTNQAYVYMGEGLSMFNGNKTRAQDYANKMITNYDVADSYGDSADNFTNTWLSGATDLINAEKNGLKVAGIGAAVIGKGITEGLPLAAAEFALNQYKQGQMDRATIDELLYPTFSKLEGVNHTLSVGSELGMKNVVRPALQWLWYGDNYDRYKALSNTNTNSPAGLAYYDALQNGMTSTQAARIAESVAMTSPKSYDLINANLAKKQTILNNSRSAYGPLTSSAMKGAGVKEIALGDFITSSLSDTFSPLLAPFNMIGNWVNDRYQASVNARSQNLGLFQPTITSPTVTKMAYTPTYTYYENPTDMYQAQANNAFIQHELSKYQTASRGPATDYYSAYESARINQSLANAQQQSIEEQRKLAAKEESHKAYVKQQNDSRNIAASNAQAAARKSSSSSSSSSSSKATDYYSGYEQAARNRSSSSSSSSSRSSSSSSSSSKKATDYYSGYEQAARNRKSLKKTGKGDEGFSISAFNGSSLTDVFDPIKNFMFNGYSDTGTTINNASNVNIPQLDYSKFNTLGSYYDDGMMVNQYYVMPSQSNNDEQIKKILTNTYNVRAERVEQLLEEISKKMDDMKKDKPKQTTSVPTSSNTNLFPDNEIPAAVNRIAQ